MPYPSPFAFFVVLKEFALVLNNLAATGRCIRSDANEYRMEDPRGRVHLVNGGLEQISLGDFARLLQRVLVIDPSGIKAVHVYLAPLASSLEEVHFSMFKAALAMFVWGNWASCSGRICPRSELREILPYTLVCYYCMFDLKYDKNMILE